MISDYCNQTFVWKSKSGVNDFNEPSYEDKTTKGRLEFKRRLIRNKLGQEVISEAKYFTNDNIKVDDALVYDNRNWIVISVSPQADLDGNVQFHEVSL